MKIYIAAPFQIREGAIAIMRQLEVKGHVITSRWLKDVEDPNDQTQQAAYADKALADVLAADALLALNYAGWERRGTGGRHVELGYALAFGKQIVLFGERSNVFHHMPHVRQIRDLEDL